MTSSSSFFGFGERLAGYAVPVLNERAVRAAAGLLFLFAGVSFMNAWLTGNFRPTRVFVVAFLVDFTLRLFVNPRFAPSLIAGQWFVRHQQPEYVGAPQKRFAWAIGFVLAAAMFWLVVLHRVVGPINLFVCAACLTLLFFEAAFGICIGCKVYNLLMPSKAQLCPGDACEAEGPKGPPVSAAQGLVVAGYAALVFALAPQVAGSASPIAHESERAAAPTGDAAEAQRCKVPDFAKAMGHEQMWRLHNNCP